MFKKKAKGDKIKIQFNISFISLKEIPANCNGKEVWIQCKRGKKSANLKNTRHITIKDKEQTIDDKLSFSVSFYQKDKKYEPKKEIAFSLTEMNGKKEEAIAKNKLDLAEFAEPGSVRHQSITLINKDKKKSGTLALKIEAQPIKIGDKLAVKATSSSSDKPTVNIGGENYTLQTSDEITETNASNSDGEEDIDFPDEDAAVSPNKQIAALAVKPKSSSVSTSESPMKSEAKPANAAADSAALADAKRDNERLQRKIERLEAAAKTASSTSNAPSAAELAETEDLKRDKQRLERKVEKLTQQLEELRAVSPSATRKEGDGDSPSASAAAVEMEKQLKSLLSDKKKLEEELEESNRNHKKETSEKNKMKDELERMTKKETDTRKKSEETEKKKNGELEQAKKDLSAKETALIALEVELKSLKESSKSTKSDKGNNETELKELQEKSEEVSKLEEELAKEKNRKTSLPSSPSISSSSGNTEDKEKIKELEKKNAKLEKQIAQLKEDLEESGEQSSHKEKKLQKLLDESEKELENLRSELEKVKESSRSSTTSSSKSNSDGAIDEEEAVKLKLQAKRAERESESLKKKIAALQKENQEKSLVESGIYAADVEYEDEIPVGVKHIVDGMLESNAFEPFNEDLASSILNAIKKSFARSAYDSETLTYWLSFSIHLFKRIKSELPSDVSIDEKVLSKPDMVEDTDDYDSVTKFLLELINISFDIYSVLLINIFSQLDSVLISTILSVAESKGKKSAPTGDFTGLLNDTMKMLKKHNLSDSLVKSFVQQMFSFIDSQLFNNLIQKPDLFTCSAGFQIKMAISQVEANVSKLDKSLTFITKSLNHIKEAVNFLVMDKSIVSDADMVEQIFSHLNVVQLKHMIDRFKPDELSPDPVPEVAKKAVSDAARKRADLPLELDAMEIKKLNLLSV